MEDVNLNQPAWLLEDPAFTIGCYDSSLIERLKIGSTGCCL